MRCVPLKCSSKSTIELNFLGHRADIAFQQKENASSEWITILDETDWRCRNGRFKKLFEGYLEIMVNLSAYLI